MCACDISALSAASFTVMPCLAQLRSPGVWMRSNDTCEADRLHPPVLLSGDIADSQEC